MGHKILVIDDENEFVTSLAPALALENHSVVSATNPDQAVEIFRRENPNVVLLDVNLSGSASGIALISQLKSINRNVPIIMVSGLARTDQVVESIRSGANDFFEKQNGSDALLAHIERALVSNQGIAQNENAIDGDSVSVSDIEYKALVSALEECGGNISKVAKLLSLSRDTVYRRLKKFNIGIKRDFRF